MLCSSGESPLAVSAACCILQSLCAFASFEENRPARQAVHSLPGYRAYSIVMEAPRFFAASCSSPRFSLHRSRKCPLLLADAAHRDLDAIGAPIAPMPPIQPSCALWPASLPYKFSIRLPRSSRSTIAARFPAWTRICRPEPASVPPPTGSKRSSRQISAACGGCLEVHRDTFTQPPLTGPQCPRHAAHAPSPTSMLCCAEAIRRRRRA